MVADLDMIAWFALVDQGVSWPACWVWSEDEDQSPMAVCFEHHPPSPDPTNHTTRLERASRHHSKRSWVELEMYVLYPDSAVTPGAVQWSVVAGKRASSRTYSSSGDDAAMELVRQMDRVSLAAVVWFPVSGVPRRP